MRPDVVAKRGITYLNLLLICLASLPGWITPLQDALTPVGIPVSWWIYAPVAIAVVTILARQGIAALQIVASGFSGTVKVGFSTILGYALTFLTGLPAALAALDEATRPLNVDPLVFVKAGAILTAATTIGYALQAAAAGYNRWKLDKPDTSGVPVEPDEQPPVVTEPTPPANPPTDTAPEPLPDTTPVTDNDDTVGGAGPQG